MTENNCDDISTVAAYRRRRLYDEGNLSNSASLEELQNEYMRIQQQRWEYACLYHSYETYCFSRSVTPDQAKAVFFTIGERADGENIAVAGIGRGKPDDKAARVETEDVMKPDSVTTVVQEIYESSERKVGYNNGLLGTLLAHCARTAACNLYAVAQTAGLGDPISGGETACARTIHGGVKKRKAICDGRYSNTSMLETLNELVASGKIGPGSIVSYCTDPTPKPGLSGFHAITIASVNRDENGNIISYTIMDNNGGKEKSRIKVLDINDGEIGGEKVLYTNAYAWAMDEYRAQMEGKSEEELKAMIEEAKRETDVLIGCLAEQENILLNDNSYTLTCGGSSRANLLEGHRRNLNTFYNNQYVKAANEYLASHPIENVKETKVAVPIVLDVMLNSSEMTEFRNKISGILNKITPTSASTSTSEYTPEERIDVKETMEEQRVNAEEKYQENREDVAQGMYGSDVKVVAEKVDESMKSASPSVAREKTPVELKKIAKMQSWFSNPNVKLNPEFVDTMVNKYGVDVAYDLVLKSMMEPYNVCQNAGISYRNSKNCINYFLENDVPNEVVANVTGRSIDDIKVSKTIKDNDKSQIIRVEMNPALRSKLYGVKSL